MVHEARVDPELDGRNYRHHYINFYQFIVCRIILYINISIIIIILINNWVLEVGLLSTKSILTQSWINYYYCCYYYHHHHHHPHFYHYHNYHNLQSSSSTVAKNVKYDATHRQQQRLQQKSCFCCNKNHVFCCRSCFVAASATKHDPVWGGSCGAGCRVRRGDDIRVTYFVTRMISESRVS